MVIGQDLIHFNNPDDWDLATNITKIATASGVNSYSPIETFDLNITLSNTHIAILVTTSEVRPNWKYAGELTQTYDFAKGSSNTDTDKVLSRPYDLLLNKLTVLDVAQISLDPSRLLFTPPDWFRDVTVRVYVYTGNITNFVKDSLADISNTLSDGTVGTGGSLELKIDELLLSIQNLAGSLSGVDCNIENSTTITEINSKLDQIIANLNCPQSPTDTDSSERKNRFFLMN